MKVIGIQSILQAALLAIVFTGAAQADDRDTSAQPKQAVRIHPPYSKQVLQEKIEYCKTCHGPSAEGVRGTTPIPRLAGQQPQYLQNQLRAFGLRSRQSNVMFNVAHAMSPAIEAALADYFRDLNPKPVGGAPKELAAAGKRIYEEGVPEANVPPCASCHGLEAKGDGAYPRLAGQLHDYITNKLTNWEKERGQDLENPDKSAVMKPIAHNLTAPRIAAVAAYLNYLE